MPLEIDDAGKGSKRRTRIFDMPFNFVERPTAANEKQIVPDLEDEFPDRNPSFFFLLCQVRRLLLSPSANGEVHPVPEEARQAVDDELREAWMDDPIKCQTMAHWRNYLLRHGVVLIMDQAELERLARAR